MFSYHLHADDSQNYNFFFSKTITLLYILCELQFFIDTFIDLQTIPVSKINSFSVPFKSPSKHLSPSLIVNIIFVH